MTNARPSHDHLQYTDIGSRAFQGLPNSLIWRDDRHPTPISKHAPAWLRGLYYRLNAIQDLLGKLLVPKGYNRYIEGLSIKHLPDLFFLAITGAFSADDYYRYGLYLEERPTRARHNLIGYFRRHEVRDRKNCHVCSMILQNKILAVRYLERAGVPCGEMVAFAFAGQWYTVDYSTIERYSRLRIGREIPEGVYFLKPAVSRWGKGAALLDLSSENIAPPILGHPPKEPYILEKYLTNSPFYRFEDSNSLNTVRIMTEFSPSSVPRVFAGAIRIGLSGSHIDNWSAGGIAARIDVKTASIGAFYKKGTALNSIPHPLTGATLPDWLELSELAIQAHTLFPTIRSIGWDVASTTEGARIIEGNDDWDIVLPQRLERLSGARGKIVPQFMLEKQWP